MFIIKCSKLIINYAFSANAALYAVFSNLVDCSSGFRSTQNTTSCVALLLSIMILGWGGEGNQQDRMLKDRKNKTTVSPQIKTSSQFKS